MLILVRNLLRWPNQRFVQLCGGDDDLGNKLYQVPAAIPSQILLGFGRGLFFLFFFVLNPTETAKELPKGTLGLPMWMVSPYKLQVLVAGRWGCDKSGLEPQH